MGEILLEALAEIVGAFIKFLFSPKVMESLPKPIRIFIRFMTILICLIQFYQKRGIGTGADRRDHSFGRRYRCDRIYDPHLKGKVLT